MDVWATHFGIGFIGQIALNDSDTYRWATTSVDDAETIYVRDYMKKLLIKFVNFTAPSSNVIKGLHGLGNLLGKSDYYPNYQVENITVGGTIAIIGGLDEKNSGHCTENDPSAKDSCIIGGFWDRRCVGIIMGHISVSLTVTFDNVTVTEGTMKGFECNIALHGLLNDYMLKQ